MKPSAGRGSAENRTAMQDNSQEITYPKTRCRWQTLREWTTTEAAEVHRGKVSGRMKRQATRSNASSSAFPPFSFHSLVRDTAFVRGPLASIAHPSLPLCTSVASVVACFALWGYYFL